MDQIYARIITSISIGIIVTPIFLVGVWYQSMLIILISLIVLLYEWPKICAKNKQFWLLTPIYPLLPLLLILGLSFIDNGQFWFYLMCISCWSFDIGSYIVGSIIGRYRICPIITPKKTWEGFFGGIIFMFCALYAYFWIMHISINYSYLLVLTLLLSSFAFFGDLFESFIKRTVHIKDTGSILRGHGGLLDRIDSMLFVVFALYSLYLLTL